MSTSRKHLLFDHRVEIYNRTSRWTRTEPIRPDYTDIILRASQSGQTTQALSLELHKVHIPGVQFERGISRSVDLPDLKMTRRAILSVFLTVLQHFLEGAVQPGTKWKHKCTDTEVQIVVACGQRWVVSEEDPASEGVVVVGWGWGWGTKPTATLSPPEWIIVTELLLNTIQLARDLKTKHTHTKQKTKKQYLIHRSCLSPPPAPPPPAAPR